VLYVVQEYKHKYKLIVYQLKLLSEDLEFKLKLLHKNLLQKMYLEDLESKLKLKIKEIEDYNIFIHDFY
jgi:hypothetical protein